MSAATTVPARQLPRRSRTPGPEPRALKVLEAAGSIPVVIFLVFSLVSHRADIRGLLPSVVAWLLIVVIADSLPVPIWRTVQIAISFPVLLAAGMLFPPYVACFLAFFGPTDLRELRGEISLMRSLFNRANIALSILAASAVFHAMGGELTDWPLVLPIALLALVADVVLNGVLVTAGTHLLTGVPFLQVWRNISGGGLTAPFLLSYLAFGFLAVLLATAYLAAGNWALVIFTIPMFLARQMFMHWKHLAETSEELAVKNRALITVTEHVAEERRDERLTIASGIHDEVLPPLYKIHLMAQVLRQDLASGRLLELEDDLPVLLQAVDVANDAMRGLIRDLRDSPLGSRGLASTIRLVVTQLQVMTAADFELELEEVDGSPITQLIAYQVAREAIANATRHSHATRIRVFLGVVDGSVRLVVEDDGRGFAPGTVDGTLHFGLQLMRERVELAGGTFVMDTQPGEGTTIVARFPIEAPSRGGEH